MVKGAAGTTFQFRKTRCLSKTENRELLSDNWFSDVSSRFSVSGDPASAYHYIMVVENGCLPRCDRPLRLVE